MPKRKTTSYIVVHVSAIRPSQTSSAADIDRWHKARGWSGIGYHYVIRRNGTLEKGRDLDQIGAHVSGYNSTSIGVCLEGGLDDNGKPSDTRTPEQVSTLWNLLESLTSEYPGSVICGHRDLSPDRDGDGIIEAHEHLKACPCFDVIPEAKARGLPTLAIQGDWDFGPDSEALDSQILLKEAGYEFGPLDGIVGPKTRAAIKRFQKAADLPITGRFDRLTLNRLQSMHAKRRRAMASKLSEVMEERDALKQAIESRPVEQDDSSRELQQSYIARIFMRLAMWLSGFFRRTSR